MSPEEWDAIEQAYRGTGTTLELAVMAAASAAGVVPGQRRTCKVVRHEVEVDLRDSSSPALEHTVWCDFSGPTLS